MESGEVASLKTDPERRTDAWFRGCDYVIRQSRTALRSNWHKSEFHCDCSSSGRLAARALRVNSLVLGEKPFRRGINILTMKPIKHIERGLAGAAGWLFNSIQLVNRYKPNPSFTPKWSDKPLLKSWQKTKPTLGWPRTTDSLCPNCVIEARESILRGDQEVSILVNEKVGEIKAQIIERNGEIWMVKDCLKHGHFEDMMAIDSKFLQNIETMFPGRDIEAHNDEKLHNHG